ncbi:MAG: orotidine 5'-phosphate decarboxylase / HUMPS family protein [Candidatus Micrarchaeales archaeon]
MADRLKSISNKLPEYKVKFIEALVDSGALKLNGDYALKSKRESPYFINVGGFNSASNTEVLANAYANAISERLNGKFDHIYGIPEKGVSLAPTISMALWQQHKIDSNWFFDRKGGEKQYGEATGLSKDDMAKFFVGSVPEEGKKILVVDDVLTTGGTKEDALKMLARFLPKRDIVGIFISVDRQEVGIRGRSAVEEFTEKTGVPVYSILKASDIVQYMKEKEEERYESPLRRMSTYIRVYGTKEAREFVATNVPIIAVMKSKKSLIPACDTRDMNVFEELVKQTSDIEGIGGYKIGFMLGLTYSLPKVVEIARKYTDKPLIYDHQKAATDIPDTAKSFMELNKDAGINAVILFPHTGPETERAWIYRAMDNGLGVIVGGIMTHPGYLVSEGGFMIDEGALDIYRIAAKAGVTNFVVPGTKPEMIKMSREVVEKEKVDPEFYPPGFGAQNSNVEEAKKVLGSLWHPIVGRQMLPKDKDYRKAAEETIAQLLR